MVISGRKQSIESLKSTFTQRIFTTCMLISLNTKSIFIEHVISEV